MALRTVFPAPRVWHPGHELQLAEDVFKLQHLLECNILRHREELEEITNAAVNWEEQIETKLAAIESDWAALNLVGLGAPSPQSHHDAAQKCRRLHTGAVGPALLQLAVWGRLYAGLITRCSLLKPSSHLCHGAAGVC